MLKLKHIEEEQSPNYITSRLNAREGTKSLIQIIDMSDKMLFNEMKAE
jgi:hypothetical protein